MLLNAENRAIDWDSFHDQVIKRKEQLMAKPGLSPNNGLQNYPKKRRKK